MSYQRTYHTPYYKPHEHCHGKYCGSSSFVPEENHSHVVYQQPRLQFNPQQDPQIQLLIELNRQIIEQNKQIIEQNKQIFMQNQILINLNNKQTLPQNNYKPKYTPDEKQGYKNYKKNWNYNYYYPQQRKTFKNAFWRQNNPQNDGEQKETPTVDKSTDNNNQEKEDEDENTEESVQPPIKNIKQENSEDINGK